MFPEGIGRNRLLKPMKDAELAEIGQESYFIASQFNLFEYEEEAPIFATLSNNFPLCSFGLSLVRQNIGKQGPQ